MPAIFIGHGSPMNAIEENNFTRMLSSLGKKIPTPKAILCISAHWMSEGTWITHIERPKTIHDFYGFPQELFEVQYPAMADLELANQVISSIKDPRINADKEQWGYDHGTWSVLKHMYPKADIPLLQLSLYMEQPGEYHLKLGEQLRHLRDEGVLILGSGNIVHNLRVLNWSSDAEPYDWAIDFDEWVKQKILQRDFLTLAKDAKSTEAGIKSVPTWDHFLPLLYILGASHEDETLNFEFEEIHNSSISMRSFSYGLV